MGAWKSDDLKMSQFLSYIDCTLRITQKKKKCLAFSKWLNFSSLNYSLTLWDRKIIKESNLMELSWGNRKQPSTVATLAGTYFTGGFLPASAWAFVDVRKLTDSFYWFIKGGFIKSHFELLCQVNHREELCQNSCRVNLQGKSGIDKWSLQKMWNRFLTGQQTLSTIIGASFCASWDRKWKNSSWDYTTGSQ